MTIEIIPAIIPFDASETAEQLATVRSFTRAAQLDIDDGEFTPRTSLQSSDIPKILLSGLEYEVHLMVKTPEKYVEEWMQRSPKRIIVHAESKPSALLLQEISHEGIEPVIALTAHTDLDALEPYLHLVRTVLFLCIDPPGDQGRKLLPFVLERVAVFHQKYPSYTIEVDGGINEETMKKVIASGATRLVVGSAIFSGEKPPAEQYLYVQQLAEQCVQNGNIQTTRK